MVNDDGAGYGGGEDVSPIWKVTELLFNPLIIPCPILKTGAPMDVNVSHKYSYNYISTRCPQNYIVTQLFKIRVRDNDVSDFSCS